MSEEKELARITVWDREDWSEHEAGEIARWLRAKAREIEDHAEAYSSKVRFRYFR